MKKKILKRFAGRSLFLSVGSIVFSTFLVSSAKLNHFVKPASEAEAQAYRKKYKLDEGYQPLSDFFVVDGDTIHEGPQDFTPGFNKERFRIIGIDTPETGRVFKGVYEETTGIKREYGMKSTNFLKNLFEKAKYVFWKHIKNDHYGRHIARINVDGEDLSILLVKKGLAMVEFLDNKNPKSKYYYDDNAFFESIHKAQDQAKASGAGFWILSEDELKEVFPHYKKKK